MITVARYELYPGDQPTCTVVGFKVTVNGREFYRDAQVPLADTEGLTDEQITDLAYPMLQDDIEAETARLEAIPALIGMPFTPEG